MINMLAVDDRYNIVNFTYSRQREANLVKFNIQRSLSICRRLSIDIDHLEMLQREALMRLEILEM